MAKAPKPDDAQAPSIVRIHAPDGGIRRAGMRHDGVREYPLDAFTAEQLATLQAEPALLVEVIEPLKG